MEYLIKDGPLSGSKSKKLNIQHWGTEKYPNMHYIQMEKDGYFYVASGSIDNETTYLSFLV